MSLISIHRIITTFVFFCAMWYAFHTKSSEDRLKFNESCESVFGNFTRNVLFFVILEFMVFSSEVFARSYSTANNLKEKAAYFAVFHFLMSTMFYLVSVFTEAYCFNGIILFSIGLWVVQQLTLSV